MNISALKVNAIEFDGVSLWLILSQIEEILSAERQQPPDQQRHGRRFGKLHLRRTEQTPEHLSVLRALGARWVHPYSPWGHFIWKHWLITALAELFLYMDDVRLVSLYNEQNKKLLVTEAFSGEQMKTRAVLLWLFSDRLELIMCMHWLWKLKECLPQWPSWIYNTSAVQL